MSTFPEVAKQALLVHHQPGVLQGSGRILSPLIIGSPFSCSRPWFAVSAKCVLVSRRLANDTRTPFPLLLANQLDHSKRVFMRKKKLGKAIKM